MRPAPRNSLSDRALSVARIHGVINAILSVSVVAILLSFGWLEKPIAMLAITIVVAATAMVWFVAVSPKLLTRRWRYELLEDELYVQQGIIVLRRLTIPCIRIQNVATSQGPLAKLFGVSAVTVSTAGGGVEIPFLDDPVASQLRDHIDARARAAREEEHDAG